MIQFQNQNITVFESALYRTTTSVITTPDCVIIVDPNWLPHEIKAIQDFVTPFDQPKYLLFTHSDYDHIIGYKAFEVEKVIASEDFINHPNKEKNLQQLIKFDDEYYITRNYDFEYPTVDIVITKNGQQLEIGETRLTFYLAPGHTSDGIFTIVESHGILIAGDYLSNVEFPFIYDGCAAYLKTLKTVDTILENHEIKLLVPGHGDVTTDIKEIRKRKSMSYQYIQNLKTAILIKEKTTSEDFLNQYDYKISLRKAHEENRKIVSEELKE